MTTEPNSTPESTPIGAVPPVNEAIVAAPGAEPKTAAATPAPSPEPTAPAIVIASSNWQYNVDLVLLGLLLVLSFFLASFAATNSDVWMNLAIGKRLSEGTFEFGVDPFSWASQATDTKPASFWVHQGWLSSWLFYRLYLLAGGEGLVIAKAILFILTMSLLSRIGWRENSRWFLIICLVMAALSISTRLLLQPMVISFAFLALTLLMLHRAQLFDGPSAESKPACTRCLWVLPPLFALWANLDPWFILGPLLVGLCWAASALDQWNGRPLAVPGRTLGLVFAVGLAACLLNPYHVRVFQLPWELAYLLASLRIPLPDAFGGGGRTMQLLRQAEPGFSWTISPLAPQYWKNQDVGYNVAGLAFYPLLVLGAAGFALTAFVKPQPDAPTFRFARFLPWLLFAMMALGIYRMIPFFAIVAAPLTAMTLGEFLQWQQTQAKVTTEKRNRGLQLARMISIPFMLLLLYLAWPGWLHGPTLDNARRRVAWEVRTDVSLENAAKTLQALKQNKQGGNVFSLGLTFDLPNYCAWYAPDVQCSMDSRFALFPDQVVEFVKARQALVGDPRRKDEDWQALFERHQVDQVVVSNFIDQSAISSIAATGNYLGGPQARWWVGAETWRQRRGDNRAVVFSWAGPNRSWKTGTVQEDLNRQAFGDVPLELRPPASGTMQPQQKDWWELYKNGVGPQPQAGYEAQFLGFQYETEHQLTEQFRVVGDLIFSGTLANVQALPGGGITIAPCFASLWFSLTATGPRDYAPPALPILMVRAARKAVAENPYDPASWMIAKNAFETLQRKQEDYWIVLRGARPGRLRERLRQTQSIAAIYDLTQLQPERAELHYFLSNHYRQNRLFDLALEHMQKAVQGLEGQRSRFLNSKEFDANVKKMQEDVKAEEKRVQLRLAKLKEQSAGKSPLAQAEFAVYGTYKEVVGEQVFQSQLGLANKAMEILLAMQPAPEDRFRYLHLRFQLLVAMGRVDVVANDLKEEEVRKSLPPVVFAEYEVLAGGVLGDYETMYKGLAELEKAYRKTVAEQEPQLASSLAMMFVPPGMNYGSSYFTFHAMFVAPKLSLLNEVNGELFNIMTLHGIANLEAGDTKNAREIFRAILHQAGPTQFFSERAIAERYRELLDGQK